MTDNAYSTDIEITPVTLIALDGSSPQFPTTITLQSARLRFSF